MSTAAQIFASVCLAWSIGIFIVQFIGISRLFCNYSKTPRAPVSPSLPTEEIPHITIIRPVKGIEAGLYDCITSVFKQDYPKSKLSIRLCVAEKSDPAYPILCRIIADFPDYDAQVLVEEEDPVLHGAHGYIDNLGPNPKIRNISRAYGEAPGDLIWIVDCNVWIGHGVAGRMVDKIMGFRSGGQRGPAYKFVHQLPLLVDVDRPNATVESQTPFLSTATGFTPAPSGSDFHVTANTFSGLGSIWTNGGGRLDEMFMATTHAKFYSAINTVSVAPCIVGKSNMFRKSHLDMVTDPMQNPILAGQDKAHLQGIDYFSMYICEDHLIGDLLWRSKIPGFRNHGLCVGDLAIQPASGMSVGAFAARRSRWLRARKWTVLAATLVEPGVESLLCCGAFSYAATTLPWFSRNLNIPATGSAQFFIWLSLIFMWMTCDYFTFSMLHAGSSVEIDADTPVWARGTAKSGSHPRRPFLQWIAAWIGRELLAFPIWTYAVLLGATVNWRGRSFRVRMDMSVVEVESSKKGRYTEFAPAPVKVVKGKGGSGTRTPELEMGRPRSSKYRLN